MYLKLSGRPAQGGFSPRPTFSSGELFEKLLGYTSEYIVFVKKTSREILENFLIYKIIFRDINRKRFKYANR